MKKILKYIFITIFSLVLIGCGEDGAEKRAKVFLKNMTNNKILEEIPYAKRQSTAFGEIFKKNTYQITNIILDEKIGFAYIDVKMKIVNLSHFKNEFILLNARTAMNTEQSTEDFIYMLKQFFDKKIKENDIYFIERNAKIRLFKNKNTNKWEISNPEEILNIMLAGFVN